MSQASFKAILVGADLIAALSKTTGQIKWVRKTLDGPEVIPIAPAMAIPIVRAGRYEGKANHGYVVLIREREEEVTRSQAVADPSFWSGRGVRRFFVDQRSQPGEYFVCKDGHLCYGRRPPGPRPACRCPRPAVSRGLRRRRSNTFKREVNITYDFR